MCIQNPLDLYGKKTHENKRLYNILFLQRVTIMYNILGLVFMTHVISHADGFTVQNNYLTIYAAHFYITHLYIFSTSKGG